MGSTVSSVKRPIEPIKLQIRRKGTWEVGPRWNRRGFLRACTLLPRELSRIFRRELPRKRRRAIYFFLFSLSGIFLLSYVNAPTGIGTDKREISSFRVTLRYVVISLAHGSHVHCAWPSRRHRRSSSRQSARVYTFLITQNHKNKKK